MAAGGLVTRLVGHLDQSLGGSAKARLAALLAVTFALDSIDRGSIGALAPTLEDSLQFSNTGLGMLLAAVSITGAVATLGAGVLVDRYNRTRLLAGSLTLWVVAMAAGALAQSFTFLLLSRVALGVVLATVGPASASLVGDLYSDDRRGQVMSWIRSGDLMGVAMAFLLVGSLTWLLSWRAVFVALALLGTVVAWRCGRPSSPVAAPPEAVPTSIIVRSRPWSKPKVFIPVPRGSSSRGRGEIWPSPVSSATPWPSGPTASCWWPKPSATSPCRPWPPLPFSMRPSSTTSPNRWPRCCFP